MRYEPRPRNNGTRILAAECYRESCTSQRSDKGRADRRVLTQYEYASAAANVPFCHRPRTARSGEPVA